MFDFNNFTAQDLQNFADKLPKRPDYLPVRTVHIDNYSKPVWGGKDDRSPRSIDVDVDENNVVQGFRLFF